MGDRARRLSVAFAALLAIVAGGMAEQPANATTLTAKLVPQVTLRISTTPATGLAGTPVVLRASGGSGKGAVTFAVTGTGCSVRANVLTANRPTRCSVIARKAGSGRYRAARSAPVVFVISGAPQSALTIASPSTSGAAGTPIALTTTGGSGTGLVSYAATGTGCSVSGDQLAADRAANCVVVATKAASGIYREAQSPPVTFSFAGPPPVVPPPLTPPPGGGSSGGGGGSSGGGSGGSLPQATLLISTTPTSGFAGTPITLTTTGGSGAGPVTFAATGAGCAVSGSQLSASQPTTCTVVATKAASGSYLSASSAAVEFTFAAGGVAVSVDLFGIHIDPALNGQTTLAPAVVRLWDLHVAWPDVNPSESVFTWTELDRRVAEVEALGARPLLVLGLTPPWAASGTAAVPGYGAGSATAPGDMSTYSDYVTAVAARYKGRIAGYETWNEANLATYWTGTPAQMAELTQRAKDAVIAADPAARVFAASTTLRLSGSLTSFTQPYYTALKDRGWPIDGFTFHSYPSGTGTPVDRYALIQKWKTLLADVAGTTAESLGKIVLDTEVNYGLAGPGSTPGTDFDDATGAAFLARTYIDSVRLGVSSTVWYIWMGAFYDVVGVQMNSTTVAVNGAFAVMKSWLDGSTFRGCTTTGTVTECRLAKAGAPFTLAFADAPGTPYSNGSGTATFIDGTSAAGASVTSLGVAPVRFS